MMKVGCAQDPVQKRYDEAFRRLSGTEENFDKLRERMREMFEITEAPEESSESVPPDSGNGSEK